MPYKGGLARRRLPLLCAFAVLLLLGQFSIWSQHPQVSKATRQQFCTLSPQETLRLRELLSPPSSTPPLFKSGDITMSRSQSGQEQWALWILSVAHDHSTHPVVVESGAYDGEQHSNSILLEARGWQCILVEADPQLQQSILSKHRRCHLLRAGLSGTCGMSTLPFMMGGPLGGVPSTFTRAHLERLENDIVRGEPWMTEHSGSGVMVNVSLFPLQHDVKDLKISTVDYWSLDIEGAEASVLAATNFAAVEVGAITVEYNFNPHHRKAILAALEGAGSDMVLLMDDQQDLYFASPSYFAHRISTMAWCYWWPRVRLSGLLSTQWIYLKRWVLNRNMKPGR